MHPFRRKAWNPSRNIIMPQRFKPSTQPTCQHCGSVIRQYRDQLWRDGRGMSLCSKHARTPEQLREFLVTIAAGQPKLGRCCQHWTRRMIHKAKDLSPDQKVAIESLLGRSVAEDEAISVRTLASGSAPEWLVQSWESAKRLGLDRLSTEEIDKEIDAARKARRNRQQPMEQ
jgi:hypothetical protein